MYCSLVSRSNFWNGPAKIAWRRLPETLQIQFSQHTYYRTRQTKIYCHCIRANILVFGEETRIKFTQNLLAFFCVVLFRDAWFFKHLRTRLSSMAPVCMSLEHRLFLHVERENASGNEANTCTRPSTKLQLVIKCTHSRSCYNYIFVLALWKSLSHGCWWNKSLIPEVGAHLRLLEPVFIGLHFWDFPSRTV